MNRDTHHASKDVGMQRWCAHPISLGVAVGGCVVTCTCMHATVCSLSSIIIHGMYDVSQEISEVFRDFQKGTKWPRKEENRKNRVLWPVVVCLPPKRVQKGVILVQKGVSNHALFSEQTYGATS